MNNPEAELRLNRFLARAGFGSRRAVEELVRAGRVMINGSVNRDLAVRIDPARDRVQVDGKSAVLPTEFRIYAFHKPLEVVCTFKGQGGQPTLLPYKVQAELPERFNPVGRLDSDSTGLLLWTDDGGLNQRLCRPDSGVWKTYEVTLAAALDPKLVSTLSEGAIQIDGRACLPCRLEGVGSAPQVRWVMHLHEGRRRQIRRMFESVGARVIGLHRTNYGPIRLGKLRPGDFRRLTESESAALGQAAGGTEHQRPQGV